MCIIAKSVYLKEFMFAARVYHKPMNMHKAFEPRHKKRVQCAAFGPNLQCKIRRNTAHSLNV